MSVDFYLLTIRVVCARARSIISHIYQDLIWFSFFPFHPLIIYPQLDSPSKEQFNQQSHLSLKSLFSKFKQNPFERCWDPFMQTLILKLNLSSSVVFQDTLFTQLLLVKLISVSWLVDISKDKIISLWYPCLDFQI